MSHRILVARALLAPKPRSDEHRGWFPLNSLRREMVTGRPVTYGVEGRRSGDRGWFLLVRVNRGVLSDSGRRVLRPRVQADWV
jgi:hypothetical protein